MKPTLSSPFSAVRGLLVALTLSAFLGVPVRSAQAQTLATQVTIAVPGFFTPARVRQAFPDSGDKVATLSELLSDLFQEQVKRNCPSIRFVERREVARVISELKLDESALTEGDGASRMGQFLRADYVLIGTVTEVGVAPVPRNRQSFPEYGRNPQEVIVSITGRLVDIVRNEVIETKTVSGRARLAMADRSGGPSVLDLIGGKANGKEEPSVIKAAREATRLIGETVEPHFNPMCKVEKVWADGDVEIGRGEGQGSHLEDTYTLYWVREEAKIRDTVSYDLVEIGEAKVVKVQPQSSRLRSTRAIPAEARKKKLIAVRVRRPATETKKSES